MLGMRSTKHFRILYSTSNLYFRTCYLLLLGVNPVYVLEGSAPELKYKTIAARNALQFKGKKPKTEKTRKCKDRSHFNYTLRLCEELLKYMGITCVKGKGEAEAMCAYLNEKKFVDGCITQDSDCFAYGAKTVYRNFSISQQGLHSANGGAIDEYNIDTLEINTGIGRYKIIALALICGSDYSDGVFGVGKDSVLKLFDGISDSDILKRLKSWKTNNDYYESLERHLNSHNICSLCGHIGKLLLHEKDGCNQCDIPKGCKAVGDINKDRKAFVKNELNIRKRTLNLPNFPNEELIDEYLVTKESIPSLNINWKQPNLIKFIEFTVKYLQWEEIYAFEKFFPVLTRWHLVKYSHKAPSTRNIEEILFPDYIKKVRNPKGTPSYEIIWQVSNDIHKDIIPPEQLETVTSDKLLSSIEPQHLVENAYPELIDKFNASKIKPKITKKRQQKEPCNVKKKTKTKDVSNVLKELHLDNQNKSKGQARISVYLQKNSEKDVELDQSNFGDENDLDVSDIVDNIINYNEPDYIKESMQKIQSNTLESSFFMKFSTDADLFEQTFTNFELLSSSEDSDLSE
ncbi:XPG I-region [Popillia japonica]|uniref:XPG I-region n=1 Tax=Popillia japonica TaxID=7064 RepID=A0AAW1LS68_POPJA